MSSTAFRLRNPNLDENDNLYHLGLHARDDLPRRFGDVKFVCLGGKPSRMCKFAKDLYERLGKPANSVLDGNNDILDIAGQAGRYSMFKVGEVLSVSHGIGMASLSVVLNEILKLLHHARCADDVKLIRIGSSGGLGEKPGTIVVTNQPYNSALQKKFNHVSLGEKYSLPCATSSEMRASLIQCAKDLKTHATGGNTLSADDFFEGQGRTDGAFCFHEENDKRDFLKKVHDNFGIKNMEMEAVCLAAMCNRAGLECAIICTVLVNRLNGDTVNITGEDVERWEVEIFRVVGEYIRRSLQS